MLAQDDVIRLLIERRNELLGLKYILKGIPDKRNRTTEEVDAVFECDRQQPLAIEHTRLETYRQQIRDEKVFERYVAPVEAALAGRYGDLHVGITFLYLRDGDWSKELLAPLREWLDVNLAGLPVQESGRLPPEQDIPGVGVVRVSKREKTRRPGIYVSRTVPSNVEIPGEAVETMNKALAHKYERLAEYRQDGHRSLMLLDGRDIALTNEGEQYKAYLRVCKANLRPGLDEVWLASVFDGLKESHVDYYCFRGDDDLMRQANPENFMFERRYDDHWYKVIDKEDAG